MTTLLKGAPVVAAMNEATAARSRELQQRGITPTLAIVRVGADPSQLSYERGALKRAEKNAVQTKLVTLPQETTEGELIRQITALNEDDSVHGVLLLRPLPAQISDDAARGALAPGKDVDGITDASVAGVVTGDGVGFAPCTPQATIEILDYYGVPLEGARALVIGRSLVVGKPAALMLLARNATVTMAHSHTRDLAQLASEQDIIIAAVGRTGMVDSSFLRPGQTVIDVGINVDANGKLCGDVDAAAAEGTVDAYTPVPGGVGTVTTSVLMKHVVQAATPEHASGLR
jgi:methylenetetrahydrofolate dehydrogenase (NADP+)/methenyltetrahydrofolate cyclohydrolase